MILEYGFSLIGKSHISSGKCCQDAHRVLRMDNGWIIAAVADGVGSAANSQIGSRVAVDTAVEFCNECMPWDYNIISIKSMMRTAYNYAFKCIRRIAEKENNPIESYDTTLSMVIYDGKRIIYGHSGDGAIIGLTIFGDYVSITRPQKGADGITVVPLRAGYTNWVIDTYEEDLASVMLMTDGMLEMLCPYLLRDSETQTNKMYIPLGTYFADPVGFFEDEEKFNKTKQFIEDFLKAEKEYCQDHFYARLLAIYKTLIPSDAVDIVEVLKSNNYPVMLMQNEQDDKTIVVLINKDIPVDVHDASFYGEPDWNALQDAWNRKAYPHLYQNPDEAVEQIGGANDEKITLVNLEPLSSEKTSQDKDGNAPSVSDTGCSREAEKKLSLDSASVASDLVTDAVLSVLEERDRGKGKSTMRDMAPKSKVKEHSTKNSTIKKKQLETRAVQEMERSRHDKPKKKGFLQKLGDILDP